MSTPEQWIEALERERAGYIAFDKSDRIQAVDEQLEYWRGQLEKHGNGTVEEPSTIERKQLEAAGTVPEAVAASAHTADGQEARNDLADQHAGQSDITPETSVIQETDAAREPTDEAERLSNDLAEQHAHEPVKTTAEPEVVTEAEVVAETKGSRPALNATTDDWRKFAEQTNLGTPADAGRNVILAAYIDRHAPAGNASKEDWVTYANEHGVDTDGKSRDEIRDAVVDAGWAKPAEPAGRGSGSGPKRTTQDAKPRSTR